MHRVDGPGATVQNLFTEGDPTMGVPATTVTADIANAMQEELAHVVESAGLTLTKPDNTQLRQAIDGIVGAGRGRANAIINGDFRIWQRGTSHVATTTTIYTADRWRAVAGTGGSATLSKGTHTVGQVEVPGNPTHFLNWDQTSGGTGTFFLQQRVEYVETYAGLQVTVSWWGRVNSGGTVTITPQIVQDFGSGGSAAVTSSFPTVAMSGATFTRYETTFTVPSITGKTIGGADLQDRDDWLGFAIIWPTSQLFDVDISDVMWNVGSAPVPFVRVPLDVELAACERYFETSYQWDVAPGTGSSPAGRVAGMWDRDADANAGVSTVRVFENVPFRVWKRGDVLASDFTFYDPITGIANQVQYGGAGVAAGSVVDGCRKRLPAFTIATASLLAGSEVVECHFAIDAEL